MENYVPDLIADDAEDDHWQPSRRHFSEPQLRRWDDYSGPLADMPEETARAMLVELLQYFLVDGFSGMPMPPSGLPGTLSKKFDIDHPACRILMIGFDYFLEAARGRSRAMHNLWNDATEFWLTTKRDERERIVAEHSARMTAARSDADRQRDSARQLVYFIAADSGPIKIGTAGDPESRCKTLQTSHHEKLTILATCAGGQPLEAAYHKRFAAHRLHGEWFERTPEILAEIERISR